MGVGEKKEKQERRPRHDQQHGGSQTCEKGVLEARKKSVSRARPWSATSNADDMCN